MKSCGKLVVNDLYIHIDAVDLLADHGHQELIKRSLDKLEPSDVVLANVAKLNIKTGRISLLSYPEFDTDPFPTLAKSWTFSEKKEGGPVFRSYEKSLNPPILHRKELLVDPRHPSRQCWESTTQIAETLGLFENTSTIGFKENWRRLIAEKGYMLQGDQFTPLGNEIDGNASSGPLEPTLTVQRHLTALSRSALSAPIQLLVAHGLISEAATVFDYGCGRGDDVKGLTSNGITCGGWDPHYAKDQQLVTADIVNLGFVVNVIEDSVERVEAIERAFSLANTALVVSVMLYSANRPGLPYRDGFLTERNTFQKYFSQDEFKDYLEHVLNHDPIMIGPGIGLVFKDKEAEQRFLASRYRSSNMARRLLSARASPRYERPPRPERIKTARISKAQREFAEYKPKLDALWAQTLDLGRFPEAYEISNLAELQQSLSLMRAWRLLRTHYDLGLLEQAAQTRSEELKLYLGSLQFGKKAPYKNLEPRLRLDIRHFFGDYKTANTAALALLLDSGKSDVIHKACIEAAANGLGYLDEDRSLQLHISLVERLPAVLRAYISCGLLLWDNISKVQLIKIHIGSGKLTLMEYDNFDELAIPLLVKRVKVNIRKLDYDVFDYQAPEFPPAPLLFKSRYMHEDMPNYAEQLAFDQQIEALALVDQFGRTPSNEEIDSFLESRRLAIKGLTLSRSTAIPALDQPCGQNFTFRALIECGETQKQLGLKNLPLNPDTYNALYDLCSQVLDPVIDYFGAIRLTYGFCSSALASKIIGRIAPKLDQHASHENGRTGRPICDRLGAAVDFLVEDEDMFEVAQWVAANTPFDRMYIYGRKKPLHVSYNNRPEGAVTLMVAGTNGRLMPRSCNADALKSRLESLAG